MNSLSKEEFRQIEFDEFKSLLSPLDVVLVKKYPRLINSVISFGQKYMLRKYCDDKDAINVLSSYIHAFQVIDQQNSIGVEALYPCVSEMTLRKYCGKKLMILKLVKRLSKDEEMTCLKKEREMLNIEYDVLEYLVYPFYMAFGWSPYFWKKLWNDSNKPVCSSLVMMVLQSIGLGCSYNDLLSVPPARMPLMNDVFIVADRVIVNMPPIISKSQFKFPYWF